MKILTKAFLFIELMTPLLFGQIKNPISNENKPLKGSATPLWHRLTSHSWFIFITYRAKPDVSLFVLVFIFSTYIITQVPSVNL